MSRSVEHAINAGGGLVPRGLIALIAAGLAGCSGTAIDPGPVTTHTLWGPPSSTAYESSGGMRALEPMVGSWRGIETTWLPTETVTQEIDLQVFQPLYEDFLIVNRYVGGSFNEMFVVTYEPADGRYQLFYPGYDQFDPDGGTSRTVSAAYSASEGLQWEMVRYSRDNLTRRWLRLEGEELVYAQTTQYADRPGSEMETRLRRIDREGWPVLPTTP